MVLFDELGLPKTKRIKTGYTTDAEALQSLYAQTEHPLLEHLLRHRDMSKLLVTVEGLPKSVADDGRIHTTYSQTVAATGRLSSTDPNLQNIPIRTDGGAPDPAGVRRRRGLRVAADRRLQPDRDADHGAPVRGRGLIEAFALGRGPPHHRRVPRLRRRRPARSPPSCARKIKAMSYGLAYGLSPYGLGQQLGIPPEEARALMDEYFERFGGVRDYLNSVVDEARQTGYTETLMGRRRYLPDLMSDNRQRREMAERMALNAPIQGSAADIIKVAMLEVERALAGRRAGVPAAAPGARRARARGGARASWRPSRCWSAGRWPAPTRCERRSTCRWATGAPGTTPPTESRKPAGHGAGRARVTVCARRPPGASRSVRIRPCRRALVPAAPCPSRPSPPPRSSSRPAAPTVVRAPTRSATRRTCRSRRASRSRARTRSTARPTSCCCRRRGTAPSSSTPTATGRRRPHRRTSRSPSTAAEPAPGYSEGDTSVSDALLAQGYALAGSAYATNGWAVEDGVKADEDLYAYFTKEVGTPNRTYVWGDSLGGLITQMVAQKHPEWVSGAAPLCGVLGGPVANVNLSLDVAYALKTFMNPDLKLSGFTSWDDAVAELDEDGRAAARGGWRHHQRGAEDPHDRGSRGRSEPDQDL